MFHIYIIYSNAVDKYYVGETQNITERLNSHNSGISNCTSITKDWIMVYTESFEARNETIHRENEI